MQVFVTSFWLPKAGNIREEYEDAFYPKHCGEREGNLLRFAVADGASEGILSGKWAEILSKIFCRFDTPYPEAKDFIERAYRTWDSWKRNYLNERESRNKPIQWFEEPGLQAGAFSTFLGLVLIGSEQEPSGKWNAIALGDTCLFQVRGEHLIAKFPMEYSSAFNSRPLLISTNSTRNNGLPAAVKTTGGDWGIDDRFYLMTDALACWFLGQHETGQAPWSILRDFETNDQQRSFEEWIGKLRARKQMRNDDVTLVRIDII